MKKTRKLLCSALILTLGLSVAPFTQVSANASTIEKQTVAATSKSVQTPNSYKEWLNNELKNVRNSDEKSGIKDALKQFNSLSVKDQEKFVSYINNPEYIINALQKSEKNKKTSFNSDISVTKNITKEIDTKEKAQLNSMLYSSGTKTKKAQVSNTLEIMGIDILKTTAWVRYTHDDDSVISVDGANFVTSRNLLPFCESNWSTPDKRIDDEGRAVATADIEFKFGYKDMGLTAGSAEMGVRGDADENVDGWLTPYEE